MTDSYKSWYALRVRARCEKLVAAGLSRLGIPVCAAIAPQQRRWSDRHRLVQIPLFPGYLFAQFSPGERLNVLRTSGVAGVVGFAGEDAVVPNHEVEAIEVLIRLGVPVVSVPYSPVGARVRTTDEPTKSVTGAPHQSRRQRRVVVSVELLQRSIAVDVDSAAMASVSAFLNEKKTQRGAA